jgi:hydrogenase maturation protein HypF
VAAPARIGERRRIRARVAGVVQGVGFRPYVFRLAEELRLGGWVLNDERGVEVEVEGEPIAVDEFLARLPAEAPPLAHVESVQVEPAPPSAERSFRILASERAGDPDALVSADFATCSDCVAELFDSGDRRHRYPFINCTNCGPRFTIVRGVPYDRPLTTMVGFEMCDRCRAEYENPRDRRFHAQPNACPSCGPRVRLVAADGSELPLGRHRDPVAAAAAMVVAGKVIAIKGLGGYHLACRAGDEGAVHALRSRKHREDKPFALMCPDLDAARALVELSASDEELLAGPQRPIVIARRRPWAEVAPGVAPCSRDLGVMLPYSPLHHLLLADSATTLVMTSGNVSDEPIAYRDHDALERLGGIADAFLVGDRPIHMRTDDSVVRSLDPAVRARPLLVRRSRGYVPASIDLPLEAPPLLACGAELKSTFCVAKGRRAWVGHHIGDLKNWETLRSFREGIEHFERVFAVRPRVVAHDLHPDYLSTRYAFEREGLESVGVQHHHAHLAACLAEHGERGPAIGAIYDGSGYGPDGTVWGGELLAGGVADFERVGLLFPVRLPGGDAAVREPWRMACAWVALALGAELPAIPRPLRAEVEPRSWESVCELVRTGVGSPLTTSVGRLFDAVAALCGLRAAVHYEGQAAVELEGATDPGERGAYPMSLLAADRADRAVGEPGTTILDARETVRALLADLERGISAGVVGGRLHNALATATADACAREAERRRTPTVVLSGGVFQNRLLVERTAARLRANSLRVLLPTRLPPNDGGISYGQAAVAAAMPSLAR